MERVKRVAAFFLAFLEDARYSLGANFLASNFLHLCIADCEIALSSEHHGTSSIFVEDWDMLASPGWDPMNWYRHEHFHLVSR
jgi:hypothetical protein